MSTSRLRLRLRSVGVMYDMNAWHGTALVLHGAWFCKGDSDGTYLNVLSIDEMK